MSVDSDFKKALDYFNAGGSANINIAMDIFDELGREGYPEATYMLGRCYDKDGDPEMATKLMLIAANKGVKQAQFDVAIGYEMGKGVPQNYEEAAKWYRKAAAQGVKEAQDNLNELINEGKIKGASPSSTSSYTPPKPAPSSTSSSDDLVDQGLAAYNAKDYAKAVELWKKAADMGHTGAMNNLANCYLKGLGVPTDYTKEIELRKKAAAKGHKVSQENLTKRGIKW